MYLVFFSVFTVFDRGPCTLLSKGQELLENCVNVPICGPEKLSQLYDKKCINKEERVRHLPGYCTQTSQENKDAEER